MNRPHIPMKHVLLCALIFLSVFPLHADDNYNQGNAFRIVINRPSYTAYSRWIHLICSEIFRRMDIPLSVVYMPLKRASIEISAGRIDAEPARIYAYGEQYPDLVRIGEPVVFMTVAAFASRSELSGAYEGWASLRSFRETVGFPRGMKACEDSIPLYMRENRIDRVNNTLSGLRKLENSRIALYIDDLNSVKSELLEQSLSIDLVQAGIMEVVPLYMYVNRKFEPLAEPLSEVIKQMKQEGLIEKFYNIAY